MRRLATWLRAQWGAVVVLVASVVVAGFLLHVDYGDAFGTTYTTQVGVSTRLDDATRVVVTGVQLAGRIQQGSRITASTSEVFLVVDYTVATDDVSYGSISAKLTSGSRTYASITSALGVPAPGFQRSKQLVYEMSPDDLAGARLTLLSARDLREFERIVVVDLGLTPAGVTELIAQRYQTVALVDGDDQVQR
jgi:hypothetical protein